MNSHMMLENNTRADASIVVRETADADRVVIYLDRTDLKPIVDPDIEPAADGSGQSGVRDGVVGKAGRTKITGRRRTRPARSAIGWPAAASRPPGTAPSGPGPTPPAGFHRAPAAGR